MLIRMSFIVRCAVCWILIFTQMTFSCQAQSQLPLNSFTGLSKTGDSSLLIQGMNVFPEHPLDLELLLTRPDGSLPQETIDSESRKMINYFLAAMTTPDQDLWVNLSPYENDRIISEELSRTEMGRDLLLQDYVLKQLSASSTSPDTDLGREFWNNVYQKIETRYGLKELPGNLLNKVWITPDKVVVYENGDTAVIVESCLKVLTENDYFALKQQGKGEAGEPIDPQEYIQGVYSEVLRDLVIPEIQKAVNDSPDFMALRQMYRALILATWYKKRFKEAVLSRVYVGQKKVRGIDLADPRDKEDIYASYVEAFKKGAYDVMKEEYDPNHQVATLRHYFSGGVAFNPAAVEVTNNSAMLTGSSLLTVSKGFLAGLFTIFFSLIPYEQKAQSKPLLQVAIDSVNVSHPKEFFFPKNEQSADGIYTQDPVLSTLSRESLLGILYRQTGRSARNIFDDLERLWQEQTKSAYFSARLNDAPEKSFDGWVATLTANEILGMLSFVVESHGLTDVSDHMRYIQSVFNSSELKVVLDDFMKDSLLKSFGREKLLVELYAVFCLKRDNIYQRKANVDILLSADFKSYMSLYFEKYPWDSGKTNISDRLFEFKDDGLVKLKAVNAEEEDAKYQRMKNIFPGYGFTRRNVERFGNESEAELLRRDSLIKVAAFYGITIVSANEWADLEHYNYDWMYEEKSKKVWTFYQQKYPQIVRFNQRFSFQYNRRWDFIGPFVQMESGVSIQEFDGFIRSVGLNLGVFAFNGDETIYKDIVERVHVLRDEKFVRYLSARLNDQELRMSFGFKELSAEMKVFEAQSDPVYVEYQGLAQILFHRYSPGDLVIRPEEMKMLDSKVKLLRALTEGDRFSKIIWLPGFNRDFDEYWEEGMSQSILELFESGIAQDVYDALVLDWKFAQVDARTFFLLLANKSDRTLFLDKKNAADIRQLNDLYPLYSEKTRRPLFDLLADDEHVIYVIEKGVGIFLNPEAREYLIKYYVNLVDGKVPDEAFSLLKFDYTYRKAGCFIDFEIFKEAVFVMEQVYQLPSGLISELMYDKDNLNKEYLKQLNNSDIQKAFVTLADFLELNPDISLLDRFNLAMNYADDINNRETMGVVSRIMSFGFRGLIYEDFIFCLKLGRQDSFRKAMASDGFGAFYLEIQKTFFEGIESLNILKEASDFYGDPDVQRILERADWKQKFQKLKLFLVQKFQVRAFVPSMIYPMILLSERFEEDALIKMTKELEKTGERIQPNDLMTLARTLNDDLKQKMKDRSFLENYFQDVYRIRAAFPRQHLDYLGDRATETESRDYKASYTERPEIAGLSQLFLFKAYLLNEGLKNPLTLEVLGREIFSDIHDKKTEHGGEIIFGDSMSVTFKVQPAFSNHDGSFASAKSRLLCSGLAYFHFHALEIDHSEFSGPSGWLGAMTNQGPLSQPSGDIEMSRQAVEVVVTTMGHPVVGGVPDVNKIRVNVDMVYVDERGATPVARILDLGEFIVPYGDQAMLQDSVNAQPEFEKTPVGGIDFNPELLNMDIQGKARSWRLPDHADMDVLERSRGLVPDRIEIRPVKADFWDHFFIDAKSNF